MANSDQIMTTVSYRGSDPPALLLYGAWTGWLSGWSSVLFLPEAFAW